MKIVLRIFSYPWAVIGLLLFVVMLLVMTLLYAFTFLLFPARTAPHLAHKLSRAWASLVHVFLILPLRVKNRHYIDPKKAYVFVANHRSQLDIPVFARSNSNTFRFLAKAELTKIPLLGWIIAKTYITVKRQDQRDRNKSIEVMKRSLDSGISVFICPEGTRNRKDEPAVMDFRDGAFRLAILTHTPLAVLTVMNTADRLSPNRMFQLYPGTIYAEWSEPIDTSNMTLDDLPALKEKVRNEMTAKIRAFREGKR